MITGCAIVFHSFVSVIEEGGHEKKKKRKENAVSSIFPIGAGSGVVTSGGKGEGRRRSVSPSLPSICRQTPGGGTASRRGFLQPVALTTHTKQEKEKKKNRLGGKGKRDRAVVYRLPLAVLVEGEGKEWRKKEGDIQLLSVFDRWTIRLKGGGRGQGLAAHLFSLLFPGEKKKKGKRRGGKGRKSAVVWPASSGSPSSSREREGEKGKVLRFNLVPCV